MKQILLFTLLVYSFSLPAQDNELKELIEKQTSIESRILILEDSLKAIKKQVNHLESANIRKLAKDSTLIGLVYNNAKIKSSPEPHGELIYTLNEGEQVYILDYQDKYFGVCSDNYCGFMSEIWVQKNEQIEHFMSEKNKEAYQLEKLKQEQEKKKVAKEQAILDKKYREKYGKETFQKLQNGYYWLGMSKEMAIISLGYPSKINKTVGSWGVHEQWVYNNKNLYFKNGILDSFQN